MSLDPVETLQQLIRIPSVNPMGKPLTEAIHGESRVTDYLQYICEQHGWPWLRQRVHPGRDNLVAMVPGSTPVAEGGYSILWDVHQDTVPVDGMTVDPFGGEVRNGRVYGRGACDIKGSMAAMLAALSRLSELLKQPLSKQVSKIRPTIFIAFTVNEECGFTGVRALCNLWNHFRRGDAEITGGSIAPEKMFSHAPGGAIVAEPTQFDVVVAHKGAVRWRCHTVGRAAHTSRPEEGINAIYAMSQTVQEIERFHAQLSTAADEHPLCGRPSVCVSTIHGGVGINTVPERVTIEIDRRLSPDEHPDAAYNELIEYLSTHAELGGCRIEHDPPFMQSGGLNDSYNRKFAKQLSGVVQEFGQSSELIGVPFGTDASILSAAGLHTVVFGPGSISQAHTADEYITIDELKLATDVFFRIASAPFERGLAPSSS